jgi:acetyl-CoA carboxylase, biotin carboxylase subunit
VQVLGDGHGNVIHLLERECSLQRRRQKLIEEAPAPGLDPARRAAMCEAAVRLACAVGYASLGTVEFLVPADEGFFFIEMNTRLQVEHGVTEMLTGVDLVREQLLVAGGEALGMGQADIVPRGCALEFRINAEDPDEAFRPCPGRIEALEWPGGPGVRVDTAIHPGHAVLPYYDSLLAKLIVWAPNRDEAVVRGRRALEELVIEGVATTTAVHRRLLDDPEVVAGTVHTEYLEEILG